MATRPFIETISTRWPQDKTDEQKKTRIQRRLIKLGMRRIEDWTPTGNVLARVNQGRWIVDCPTLGCTGAEFADPDFPLMVCTSGCGQGPFGVTFPKDRAEIEVELVKRPALASRNAVGESVKELQAENVTMGVG